jgi:hypothetical protein
MAAVLKHRGTLQLLTHSSRFGSLGYGARFAEPLRQQQGAGLYSSGELPKENYQVGEFVNVEIKDATSATLLGEAVGYSDNM